MNPGDVAPMVVMVTGVIMFGLVLLLRPISKRLGVYLEVLAEERRRELSAMNASPMDRNEMARVAQILENVDSRLQRLEDKQDFTDKLLAERKDKQLL